MAAIYPDLDGQMILIAAGGATGWIITKRQPELWLTKLALFSLPRSEQHRQNGVAAGACVQIKRLPFISLS